MFAAQANPPWVWNHYRWIVWKRGCQERQFPSAFPPSSRLSWTAVVHQLLYRFEREFNVIATLLGSSDSRRLLFWCWRDRDCV